MIINKKLLHLILAAVCIGGAPYASGQDLDLVVDVGSGAVSILNNDAVDVIINSYQITDDLGFGLLNAGGLTTLGSQFGGSGFVEVVGNGDNGLAEISASGAITISAGASLTLGNAFDGFDVDPTAINNAQVAAGFGNDFLGLGFSFGNDATDTAVVGDVVFNDARLNTLVLEADASTGTTQLINESIIDVTIDVLQLTSTADAPFIAANFPTLAGFVSAPTNNETQLAQLFQPSGADPGEGLLIPGGGSIDLGELFVSSELDAGEEDAIDLVFNIVGGGAPSDGEERIVEAVVGLAGDFNDDGAVDIADFTSFRDTTGEDFQVFVDNFDNGGTSSAASVSAVPEPSSIALVMSMAGLAWPWRRNANRR